ncbi:MAG TPA: hypothetical protein VF901_23610, partial [Bradyrhizobium sp.]
PMEPFSAGERVKGMALGALAGEFRSPLGIFSGNSHSSRSVACRRHNAMPAPLSCRVSVKNARRNSGSTARPFRDLA